MEARSCSQACPPRLESKLSPGLDFCFHTHPPRSRNQDDVHDIHDMYDTCDTHDVHSAHGATVHDIDVIHGEPEVHQCVLLCFIEPIVGGMGPGASSLSDILWHGLHDVLDIHQRRS
jgi:hypothetical protein